MLFAHSLPDKAAARAPPASAVARPATKVTIESILQGNFKMRTSELAQRISIYIYREDRICIFSFRAEREFSTLPSHILIGFSGD